MPGDVEQLREYYYETLGGGKLEKTWYKVKQHFPGQYTKAEVKRFLDKQASVQQTKQFKRKPGMFTSIRGKKPANVYQIDLMFFKNTVGPQKWSGVLNVVDVYSRYAWSEPIRQDPKPKQHKKGTPWRMSSSGGKGQKSVLDAFKKIVNRGKVPKNVNMDEGNEFTNTAFQDYLAEKGITPHYSNPQTFMKNPIVERFNRTMRDKIRDRLSQGKTMNEIVQNLQTLIDTYNTDIHGTILAEPLDVWAGKAKNKQKLKDPTFDLEEGDQVRILERQSDFSKSGKYKWSEEIHTIYDVQKKAAPSSSRVARYYVMDSDGSIMTYEDKKDRNEYPTWFMGYQLQKANKAERPKGYDSKKVAREKTSQATKDAKARQKRALAKEGLDDAAPTKKSQPKRKAQADPLKLKGKQIKVKWYDDGILTTKAERLRGSQGKFFPGTVKAFDNTRKVYRVEYEDDVDGIYETNLTEQGRGSFIPKKNWARL